MRCTIITGARDAGKTRTAAALAARLRTAGNRVGGVISEAMLEDGVKTGYSYRDLLTGSREEYARRKQHPVPPGTPAFNFLDRGMAFGSQALRSAVAAGVDALFIDEIGPLEMAGKGLWTTILELLSTFKGLLILTVRPGLVDQVCALVEPFAASLQMVDAETGP